MKYFIGEVRSLKDPWQSGRIQIRIYGFQDDEQSTKDEHLAWALPLQPITSAATRKIGKSPTGMIVGSRVMGFYMDEEHQHPVILGTFARAGKLKDEQKNTGANNDIDNKYNDVPTHALDNPDPPLNPFSILTRSSSSDSQNLFKLTPDASEYNKADYKSSEDGKELTGEAKKKYSSTAELPTTASVSKNKASDIFSMLQSIDPSNKSGALLQAPQSIQRLLQLSNMTSMSGINGLTGMGMGGVLGQLSNQFGLGQITGMLSGMLGGLMSGSGGGGGGGGGGGAGLGSPQIGGADGNYYTYYVPQTIGQVAATVADILSMVSNTVTQSSQIASLSDYDKEALYTALLDLMDRVDITPNYTTTVTANVSANAFYVTTPPFSGITPTEIINGVPVSVVTTVTPLNPAVLPGALIDMSEVPNSYFQVFTYSSTDPYPGYIEWEGPNGEIVFTPRPPSQPYAATPNEDAVNAGINILLDDLTKLVKVNQTTLVAVTGLLTNARSAVQYQGNQHSLGNNSNMNIMGMLMQLLGLLGQLIQQSQQQHLPKSVLNQGKMQKTLENASKQMGYAKQKKNLASAAVKTKNQKPTSNFNPQNIQSFLDNIKSNNSAGSGNPTA